MPRPPAIQAKGTRPEERLYEALGRVGLSGYEKQPGDLVGRPDAFFRHAKPRALAIFADGCAWHGCPQHFRPGTGDHRLTRDGVARQRLTDSRIRRALIAAGYGVRAFWEHEILADPDRCAREIAAELKGKG
jgi:DNA mismatch endonuclease (patch repair protein)